MDKENKEEEKPDAGEKEKAKEETKAGTSSALDHLSQLQGTIQKAVNDNMPQGESNPLERLSHMPDSIKNAVNKQFRPASAPEETSNHDNAPTRGLTTADFIDQMHRIQKVPETIKKMIHDTQQDVAERGFSPVAMEYVPESIKKMMGMTDGQPQAGAAASSPTPESSNKAAGSQDGREQQVASKEPDVQTMSAVAEPNDTDTNSGTVVVQED
ncbi:uncharacterized protein [Littorina saxatilis]|uniref:Uncharacterized protein n=1 Tax=Littorina saxatilis TaxID=31220 RepID=A0AAN9BCD0_9CAEN